MNLGIVSKGRGGVACMEDTLEGPEMVVGGGHGNGKEGDVVRRVTQEDGIWSI